MLTESLVMAVSALCVAVLTALKQFHSSKCCFGLFELEREEEHHEEHHEEHNPVGTHSLEAEHAEPDKK